MMHKTLFYHSKDAIWLHTFIINLSFTRWRIRYMTTTIRLSTTYFKALNAHHILCLPSTPLVLTNNTICAGHWHHYWKWQKESI